MRSENENTLHDETLHLSPLFVGLTRPAMKFGVTFDYLGVSSLVTLCVVILLNNPLLGIVYIPLHVFGALVCWFDPFAFTILMKRAQFNTMPNKKYWGCFSYAPY